VAGLPNLANPAELAALTGRSAGDSSLLSNLREASRAFRGAVRHPVTRTREIGYELDGKGSRSLRLPPPYPIIVDVDNPFEVRLDGVVVPASSYRLNRRLGILTTRNGVWPAPPVALEVDFTHGYTATVPTGDDAAGPLLGLPEDIQGVVLERAAIDMTVTPGMTSRTVLGDTVTFGASAIGSTQKWAEVVDVYLWRTAGEA